MVPFHVLLGYILLFGALAVPGYVLGKMKKLGDDTLRGMSVILTDLAMPFLVLAKLLETDLGTLALSEILVAVLFPLFLWPFLYLLTRVIFRSQEKRRAAVSRFASIFPNCGFLGIPLASAMFPNDPKVCTLVAIFNVTSTFLLLTMGVALLSGEMRHIKPLGMLTKPVTIAVVLGTVLSLMGWGMVIPGLSLYANLIANLTTPLAMLVLGVELSRLRFSQMFRTGGLYAVAGVRLVLSPLIALGVLFCLKLCGVAIGAEIATAILVSTGVSSAASAPAMSKQYGADGNYAAVVTLGATILCAVALPPLSMLYGFVLSL